MNILKKEKWTMGPSLFQMKIKMKNIFRVLVEIHPYPAVNIPFALNWTNKSWYKKIYIVELVGVNITSGLDLNYNSIGLYFVVSIPVIYVESNGSLNKSKAYIAYPLHLVSWNNAWLYATSFMLLGLYGL